MPSRALFIFSGKKETLLLDSGMLRQSQKTNIDC